MDRCSSINLLKLDLGYALPYNSRHVKPHKLGNRNLELVQSGYKIRNFIQLEEMSSMSQVCMLPSEIGNLFGPFLSDAKLLSDSSVYAMNRKRVISIALAFRSLDCYGSELDSSLYMYSERSRSVSTDC